MLEARRNIFCYTHRMRRNGSQVFFARFNRVGLRYSVQLSDLKPLAVPDPSDAACGALVAWHCRPTANHFLFVPVSNCSTNIWTNPVKDLQCLFRSHDTEPTTRETERNNNDNNNSIITTIITSATIMSNVGIHTTTHLRPH